MRHHIMPALGLLWNHANMIRWRCVYGVRLTLLWSANNLKKALIVALSVIVAIGIATALPRPARRELIPANFARVEKGMSRSKVIALLGVPPGDYTTGPVIGVGSSARWWGCESWICDEGILRVQFDEDGIVYDVTVAGVGHLEPPSLFSRVRSHFGI